jgi:V/A-type H+/Na+-transporting ATPase subunit I
LLRPVEMRQLSIIVPKEELHNLLTYACQDQSLHLVDVPKTSLPDGASPFEATSLLARSSTLRSRLGTLSSVIGDTVPAQLSPSVSLSDLDGLADYLDSETVKLEQVVRHHEDDVGKLQSEQEKTQELSRFLAGLESAGVSLEAIGGKGFLAMLAGDAPRENVGAVQRALDTVTYGNVIFAVTSSHDNNQTFLAVFPAAFAEEARQSATSLGSKLEPAWADLPTSPVDAKKTIETKLQQLDESSKQLAKNQGAFSTEYGPRLKNLTLLSELLEVRSKALAGSSSTQATYMLRAWVPGDRVDQFSQGAAKACDGAVSVHLEESDSKEPAHAETVEKPKDDHEATEQTSKAPSLIRLPSWGGPLQSIINNFGVPSYNETNPFVFMIFSYPIIYGLMFGDFGEGPLFILLGLFLLRMKRKKAKVSDIIQLIVNGAELILMLGIGITVFGVVFGDFFGFESKSIFGFSPLFSPTEGALTGHISNLKEFMTIVLLFGVAHITFGLSLSAYNKLRLKEYSEALFGPVCWIIFYLAGVYLVATFALSKFNFSVIMGNPLLLVIIIVPILLMGWKEGGLHAFEAVLSSASNTFSYLRIWALNIADFFFKFALFTSMGLLGAVIGNVLVMIIEGLIVFVQTLRLHWVEWFSKFYEGAGLSFAPYTEPTGWIVPA